MKFTCILFALFLAGFMADELQSTTQISVTVANVSGSEGKVLIGLFTAENFMKKPLQTATAEIENGKATVTFKDVPKGTYAVIAHHDANSNGKMDFEASGRPKEDYGTSNNPFSMGPPNWDEAKFEVAEEALSLEVRF